MTLDFETIQELLGDEPIPDSIPRVATDLKGSGIGATFREVSPSVYKISLRSNSQDIDVSKIAVKYGGGGHRRAAGFSSNKPIEVIKKDIITFFNEEIKE